MSYPTKYPIITISNAAILLNEDGMLVVWDADQEHLYLIDNNIPIENYPDSCQGGVVTLEKKRGLASLQSHAFSERPKTQFVPWEGVSVTKGSTEFVYYIEFGGNPFAKSLFRRLTQGGQIYDRVRKGKIDGQP